MLMIDSGRSDKSVTSVWQIDASVCLIYYPMVDEKLSPFLKGQVEAAHMRMERSFEGAANV